MPPTSKQTLADGKRLTFLIIAADFRVAADLKQFLDGQAQWLVSEKWEERLGYLLAQTVRKSPYIHGH